MWARVWAGSGRSSRRRNNPARLFHISQRGFLRPGYKADVVVVRKGEPWKVTEEVIQIGRAHV